MARGQVLEDALVVATVLGRPCLLRVAAGGGGGGGPVAMFDRSRDTAEIDWTAPWRWRPAATPDGATGLVGQTAARDRLARHLGPPAARMPCPPAQAGCADPTVGRVPSTDRAALLATGGAAVAALARTSAILLHGPAGAGKSTLVR